MNQVIFLIIIQKYMRLSLNTTEYREEIHCLCYNADLAVPKFEKVKRGEIDEISTKK